MPLLHPSDVSYTKTMETQSIGLSVGSTFAGRYRILEELGKGGMGRVFKVLDTQIDEEIALKLLKPEIAADERMIIRFRDELKIARKVTHMNICRTYDINEVEGQPFITMEYVRGETLKNRVREYKILSQEKAVSLAKQICEGLVAAHKAGIVHRDLKPQNIMIDDKGQARIMDFGIARSVETGGKTQTSVMIGTPDYMSPEQADGLEADHRSDIYSMGVILFEMVTGQVPFRGDTALSIALKHKTVLPRDPRKLNPKISENLSRLILICLEKDRARRYQTAEALLEDLKNIEDGLPLGTKIRPRKSLFMQRLTRTRLFIPAGAIIVAAFIFIAVLIFKEPASYLDPNRIVVAIFDNQTGDSAHDYIGLMAQEWITQGLDRTGLVKVVPTLTVGKYYKAETGEDPLNLLVQDMKVGTVVSGSYYLQNETIKIRAEVTDISGNDLLKALDPVSGPVVDPFAAIEPLRQQLMMTLSNFFDLRIKEAAAVLPIPSSFEAYKEFMEGFELFFNNEQKEALSHFTRAAELDPEYASPRLQAAQVYLNTGQWAQAETLIREVDTFSDKLIPSELILLDFAKSWLHGDKSGMYQAQAQMVELAPNDFSRYCLGQFAVTINRPQEAIDLISPADPEGPLLKGWLHYYAWLCRAYHMLGNHKKELKAANRGIAQYPDSFYIKRNKTRALAALGRTNELNAFLEECRILPRGNIMYPIMAVEAAVVLRLNGDRDASFQLLNRVIEWQKNVPEKEAGTFSNRYGLAVAYYAAERWDDAQVLWGALQSEEPDAIDVLGFLGCLAARRGDLDEAQRISDLLENDKRPYLFGWNTFYRANIAALLKEKELAVRLLREAHSQGIDFYWFHYHSEPNVMDYESLYDYPPFREFIKPKG